METRRSRRPAEARLCMALQAEHVHIGDLQHVRVRAAVRRVASLASLDLHGFVFEDERPLFVGMALEARDLLRCRRPQLMRALRPMRIVAIGTRYKSFVYTMMERHIELWFLRQMAGIAKPRLRFGQEMFRLRVVWGMARSARDVALGMDRIDRVLLVGRALQMASQTLLVDFFA